MACIDRSKVNTPKSFPGQKSMSTSRMPMGSNHSTRGCINRSKVNTPKSFPGQKTMNPAQGVVSASKTSGLVHPSGRVGGSKKGFSSGGFKQGPCPIGSSKNSSSNSYKPHGRKY